MAKKKGKPKGQGSGEAAKKDVPPVVKAIEEAFERGNFAGVQKLAAQAGELDDEARARVEALVERTKTDPRAWLIGAGAVLLVLLVGLFTLS